MTLFEDFGYSDETPRAKWLNRLAHLYPWATFTVFAWSALTWTGIVHRGNLVDYLVLVPLVLLMLIGVTHIGLARICLRCMQAVPEDAPVRAGTRRKRFWLRLDHLKLRWFFLIVVSWRGSEFVIQRLADWKTVPGWFHVPLDLFLAAVFWATWQHHRYRPWCPWCRDWGSGGDSEQVPDPVNPATKVV